MKALQASKAPSKSSQFLPSIQGIVLSPDFLHADRTAHSPVCRAKLNENLPGVVGVQSQADTPASRKSISVHAASVPLSWWLLHTLETFKFALGSMWCH